MLAIGLDRACDLVLGMRMCEDVGPRFISAI